jgi:hypothetical protein
MMTLSVIVILYGPVLADVIGALRVIDTPGTLLIIYIVPVLNPLTPPLVALTYWPAIPPSAEVVFITAEFAAFEHPIIAVGNLGVPPRTR